MVFRVRARLAVALLAAGAGPLAVDCNGRSSRDEGAAGTGAAAGNAGASANATGGTSGTGGSGESTGGSDAGGATEAGGTSGSSAAAGVGALGGSGSGGVAGSGVTSPPGCSYNGVHYADGEHWMVDCNGCQCMAGDVVCTVDRCGTGAGGTSDSGGKGSSAGSGMGGGAAGSPVGGAAGTDGSANQCKPAPVGSFCVEGMPNDQGQALVVGMPLTLTLTPSGCYSSSCTKLVSSSCNYIGSEGEFFISSFICLSSEGDACTGDSAAQAQSSATLGSRSPPATTRSRSRARRCS